MEDILSKHIELYLSLDSSGLALLDTVIERRILKKNEFLLREGQICNQQFFVTKGGLRQFGIEQNGKETIIHFGFENWWITEMESYYSKVPSKYFIEALEDTEVLQLNRHDLNHLLISVPRLEYYFYKVLQESSVIWQNKIGCLQKPAEQRYLMFKAIYGHIEQRISQQHIASYLGISRETLSRIRAQLLKSN